MKLIELRPQGQIDLMSTMMLGQAMYSHIDRALSPAEIKVFDEKSNLIGAIFCGVAISLNENGFIVSPTLMSINEPNSRDGVYVYASKTRDPNMLTLDSRIDGFCIYGTVDLTEPKIEIFYGEELVFAVNIIVDGTQVVPKIEEHPSDSLNDDIRKIIIDSINENIMKIHIAFAAGYKAGMEAAAEAMFSEDNNEE